VRLKHAHVAARLYFIPHGETPTPPAATTATSMCKPLALSI